MAQRARESVPPFVYLQSSITCRARFPLFSTSSQWSSSLLLILRLLRQSKRAAAAAASARRPRSFRPLRPDRLGVCYQNYSEALKLFAPRLQQRLSFEATLLAFSSVMQRWRPNSHGEGVRKKTAEHFFILFNVVRRLKGGNAVAQLSSKCAAALFFRRHEDGFRYYTFFLGGLEICFDL